MGETHRERQRDRETEVGETQRVRERTAEKERHGGRETGVRER